MVFPTEILWIAVPAMAIVFAAAEDVRSREVRDVWWAVVCTSGIVLSAVSMWDGSPWPAVLSIASSLMAVYMLSERISGWYALPLLLPAAMMYVSVFMFGTSENVRISASVVPAMFILAFLMYRSGILAGGADAKCVMSIALAFPVFPVETYVPLLWAPVYPEAYVLNPAMSVMTFGFVITMLWAVPTAVRNIRRGDIGRGMLHTYRMPVSESRNAFVWPVERMENGVPVRCHACEGDEKLRIIQEMEDSGIEDVKVTPMIPFILPMAVSFILVMVLGDPFMAVI